MDSPLAQAQTAISECEGGKIARGGRKRPKLPRGLSSRVSIDMKDFSLFLRGGRDFHLCQTLSGRLEEGFLASPAGKERLRPSFRWQGHQRLRFARTEEPRGDLLQIRDRPKLLDIHANRACKCHRIEGEVIRMRIIEVETPMDRIALDLRLPKPPITEHNFGRKSTQVTGKDYPKYTVTDDIIITVFGKPESPRLRSFEG